MDLNERGYWGRLDEVFDVTRRNIPGFSADSLEGGFELIKAALN
jgi:hypothetical protein